MKRSFKKFLAALLVLGIVVGCSKKPKDEELNKVPELTLAELDQKLADKEDMVILFSWKEMCSDSKNFQENYLEAKLAENPAWKDKFYLVNLDKEMPDALVDKELRKPLMEKYGVDTSPAIVHFGTEIKKVAWTPRDNDPKTAIDKKVLDEFFDGIE